MAAVDGADALVVVTEWKEFRSPDFDVLRAKLSAAAGVRRAQPLRPGGGARGRARALRGIGRRTDARSRALATTCARRASPRPTRALVVGDVMLDRYWFGDVERISPEAPVPGRAHRAHRGTPGRRGERRAQRRRAGRAGDRSCRSSATTRPARRSSGWSRPSGVAHVAAPRCVAADDGQAARHRPAAAAAAHRLRDARRRRRCSATKLQGIRRRACAMRTCVVLSDYGKGGLAHIATMIGRRGRRARPCWSIRRATTGRSTAARRW